MFCKCVDGCCFVIVWSLRAEGVPQGGPMGLLSLPFHLRQRFFAAHWWHLYQHSCLWATGKGGSWPNLGYQ